MKRIAQAVGVSFALGVALFAQSTDPVAAPDDVILQFRLASHVDVQSRTENNQAQFHLGELIPFTYSYTAEVSDKYVLVSKSQKLLGGRGLDISCSPSVEHVVRWPASNEETTFEAMLNAPCGSGGGRGGGCSDCDSEWPLGSAPINFGPIPLNSYVHFRVPGIYLCSATAADVTTVLHSDGIRPALLVKSNPMSLTIIDDQAWAHRADLEYAGAYDKLCRGDNVVEHHFSQCSDLAQRITYLDTSDSLETEVKFFDGRNHGWDNGFWDAIEHTSYPREAVSLMTARIQELDVEVSTTVLESLASWDLKIQSPDVFQSDPATYHALAIEILRKYVRLLGNSLPTKNPAALAESSKTYRTFAKQKYCEKEPLIPKEERDQVLRVVSIRQQ